VTVYVQETASSSSAKRCIVGSMSEWFWAFDAKRELKSTKE